MVKVSTYVVIILILVGCERNPTLGMPCGYEEGEKACNDGRDNDCDGRIDSEDRDCAFTALKGGQQRTDAFRGRGEEKGKFLCNDWIDNDKNGKFDCGERACSNVLENCCHVEVTEHLCSDGIDNDDNGYTDCEDFGCRLSPYVTRCSSRKSYQTLSTFIEENTFEQCTDGLDNDNNGYTDCEDFGCKKNKDIGVRQACQESLGLSAAEKNARCEDGIDNDRDGYVDCADWDCSFNPEVTVCIDNRVCPWIG